MTYHIHSVEQDVAGKWHARAAISDSQSVFLKFNDYPSMDDIQAAAAAYVAALTSPESDGASE